MEILRMQLEEDPEPVSRRGVRIAADAETICLKCLEKDPARRYQSAGRLADDIRRFLDGEPIRARRAGLGYVLRRKLARHRTVAGVAALALVALLALAVWSYLRIMQERDRATGERDAARLAQRAEAREKRRAQARQREAEEARRAEARERDRADRQLFFANVALGQVHAAESNIASLDEVLRMCPARLRNWEWGRLRREGHQDLETLFSGPEEVHCAAVSPDGRLVAWTGYEGKLRVRELPDGEMVMDVAAHQESGYWASWSPDGKRLVTCGRDNTLKVWDLDARREVWSKRFGPHIQQTWSRITAADFSPDGKTVAYGSLGGGVYLFGAAGGEEVGRLETHTRPVTSLDFSPDGRMLITAAQDGRILLWDVSTRKTIRGLKAEGRGHAGAVTFDRRGKLLGIGYSNGELGVAPVSSFAEGKSGAIMYGGHREAVNWVAFSPDGKRVASAAGDRTIRVRETRPQGREHRTLKGHRLGVNSVVYTPDGRRLISAGDDCTVRYWDALEDRSVKIFCHDQHLYYADVSSDGKRLAAAADETALVWDIESGRRLLTLKGHTARVYGIAFDPQGKLLATSDTEGVVKIWDAASGAEKRSIQAHGKGFSMVDFSPGGRRLASGGCDNLARVWDPATGELLHELRGHSFLVTSVAFSPDGKLLATGSADHCVLVWNVADGRLLSRFDAGGGPVNRVAFDPAGKRLAVATKEGLIGVWDTSGQLRDNAGALALLKGHTGIVVCLAFSPDGKRLVSGSTDSTIRVWDPAAARELLTLKGHRGHVHSVVFTPDGRKLISSGPDGTARIWLSDEWREPRADGPPVSRPPTAPPGDEF
jgi:WD40 repeat protein